MFINHTYLTTRQSSITFKIKSKKNSRLPQKTQNMFGFGPKKLNWCQQQTTYALIWQKQKKGYVDHLGTRVAHRVRIVTKWRLIGSHIILERCKSSDLFWSDGNPGRVTCCRFRRSSIKGPTVKGRDLINRAPMIFPPLPPNKLLIRISHKHHTTEFTNHRAQLNEFQSAAVSALRCLRQEGPEALHHYQVQGKLDWRRARQVPWSSPSVSLFILLSISLLYTPLMLLFIYNSNVHDQIQVRPWLEENWRFRWLKDSNSGAKFILFRHSFSKLAISAISLYSIFCISIYVVVNKCKT